MRRTDNPGTARTGWLEAGRLLGTGVELIFTDRGGGCSPPPYDTLNLAESTGDAIFNVRGNRKKVSGELVIPPERFVFLRQVHGKEIKRAGTDDMLDEGSGRPVVIAGTDGVFTTEKMLVLAVLTADCLPLALAAPSQGVVAMLHAGWRGTIEDIAGEALKKMERELEVEPEEFHAVMGPGIGPCCYVIDEGRAGVFVERYGVGSGVVIEEGKYRLDLYQANRINMLEAGLKEDNIHRAGGCTCCDTRYFSFRREGNTGRQGAFVFRR